MAGNQRAVVLVAALCWVVVAGCGDTTTAETRGRLGDSAAEQLTAPRQPTPDASGTTTSPSSDPEEPGEADRRAAVVPAGVTQRVGEWDVTVLSAMADVTAAVLAENRFNDPPAEGFQFATVEVALGYRGTESASPAFGLSFSAVGRSAIEYGSESSCGVVPGGLDGFVEVFSGGVVTGNLCWAVAGEDVDSLLLLADTTFSVTDERTFFVVPQDGEISAPPRSTARPPAPGPEGSRGAPLARGGTERVGEWDVTVVSVTPDATAAVLAENQFNDPPEEGFQYVVAEVALSYRGDEPDSSPAGLTFAAVGDLAVAYGLEASCGVVADELDHATKVGPGGVVTGNLCWEVAGEDAGSLLLIVDDAFSFDGQRVFFALS